MATPRVWMEKVVAYYNYHPIIKTQTIKLKHLAYTVIISEDRYHSSYLMIIKQ